MSTSHNSPGPSLGSSAKACMRRSRSVESFVFPRPMVTTFTPPLSAAFRQSPAHCENLLPNSSPPGAPTTISTDGFSAEAGGSPNADPAERAASRKTASRNARRRLRACLETTRGAAARDFGCGQGGEFRASPQRAVKNESTPATDKRPAARRVFGEKAVWLRCSSVEDPPGIFSFVAPRHPAFSPKTAPLVVSKQALRFTHAPPEARRPTMENGARRISMFRLIEVESQPEQPRNSIRKLRVPVSPRRGCVAGKLHSGIKLL